MDFIFPTNYWIKMKESEKKDKQLDFARELKKKKQLWNMKVKFILIGAFDTVTKELLKGLEDLEIKGHVGTIKTTT